METLKGIGALIIAIAMIVALVQSCSGSEDSDDYSDYGGGDSYRCENCGGDGWDNGSSCVWCGGDGRTSWNP